MRARLFMPLAALCLAACGKLPFGRKAIAKGADVRLHYALEVDGRLIDSTRGRGPFEFRYGSGRLVAGLLEQLEGLKAGDKKTIEVPPEKGFGQPDPRAVQVFPASSFRSSKGLRPGAIVAAQVGGRRVQGVVREVGRGSVTLDFNHPLAGKALRYRVEVVDVK